MLDASGAQGQSIGADSWRAAPAASPSRRPAASSGQPDEAVQRTGTRIGPGRDAGMAAIARRVQAARHGGVRPHDTRASPLASFRSGRGRERASRPTHPVIAPPPPLCSPRHPIFARRLPSLYSISRCCSILLVSDPAYIRRDRYRLVDAHKSRCRVWRGTKIPHQ